jgi:hypothetical protein
MYIDDMQAGIRHSEFCCVDSYGSLWARCVENPCVTRVSIRVSQAYGGRLEKDGCCASGRIETWPMTPIFQVRRPTNRVELYIKLSCCGALS